jgi:hypothetical protein
MNLQLLNEAQIINEWSPMLESVGVKEGYKKNWLSKYCHYHQINESFTMNESFAGTGLAQLVNVPGQGPINLGTAMVTPANFYNTSYQGSGDKFPSLLPLAIQVAAKTVGFDIVSVIPMPGPTGILPYLDYIYAGGKLDYATSGQDANKTQPIMISVPATSVYADLTVGTTYYALPLQAGADTSSATGYDVAITVADAAKLTYVGKSFVTGDLIFRVVSTGTIDSDGDYTPSTSTNPAGSTNTVTIADAFGVGAGTTYSSIVGEASANKASDDAYASGNGTTGSPFRPGYVSALENHIYGFTGAGADDTNTWNGPFTDGTKAYDPMSRGTGEETYPRAMGIQTFTKNVQAGTFQVTISVTTEQIQDMNRQFGIDILAMAEGVLVNEVSQSINKHILSRAFALGWQNNYDVYQTQGFTLNLSLDPTQTTSASTSSYIGKSNSALTWNGNIPAYADYGNFENLSTAQQRIVSKIHAASNLIHTRGRRGPANFIVTNAQVLSALNIVKGFSLAPFDNTLNQSSGQLYPAGTLFGMTVYVDPNMTWNDTRILVGRKGADIEPGIKFMPYLMAESISTIAEGTMSPKIAVKSRYALVDAGFYPEAQYYAFWVETPAAGIV